MKNIYMFLLLSTMFVPRIVCMDKGFNDTEKLAKKLCKAIYNDEKPRVQKLLGLPIVHDIMHALVRCSWWLDEKVSAVHVAAAENDECLELLLQHGANPSALSERQHSPLYRVCSIKAAKLLVESGAVIDQKNTVMDCATAGKDNEALISYFIETMKADGYYLDHGYYQKCKYILSHIQDINAQYKGRSTILHKACHCAGYKNKTRYIALLLAAGADYSIRDKKGRTCLFDVLRYEDEHVCEWLLKTVFERDNNQHKSLEWLCATDNNGKSALYCAAVESCVGKLIPLLLQYGACITQNVIDDCEDWCREELPKYIS